MTASALLFRHAVAAHRAGQTAAAVALYRELLEVEPGHPRASHLLGFALLQQGAAAAAVPLLERSLGTMPLSADAWLHLGLALDASSRPGAADAAFRRCLLLAPALADAAAGLLKTRRGAGGPAPAAIAARLVTLAPLRAAGWHALGLARSGRGAGASRTSAGGTGAGGTGVSGTGGAATCFRRALLLDPRDLPAVIDLSDSLRTGRTPDAAARIAAEGVVLAPRSSPARSMLAASLYDLDRVDAAGRSARAAAVLEPGNASAYGNLAQCLYRSERYAEAVVAGRRAMAADPPDRQIQANLASYLLAVGDLEAGWTLFRHRPARRLLDRLPRLPERIWSGEPGARLLVLAEQGLGDELLFATCWPDLAALVVNRGLEAALVEVDSRLRPLVQRSYPELQWLDRDRSRGFTGRDPGFAAFRASHWTAAGDLPAMFRRRIADFPPNPRRLRAETERVARFRSWLDTAAPGMPRLGLCWRSGLRTGDRTKHYPSLAQCAPLLRLTGVRLVVLQYDDIAGDLEEARGLGADRLMIPPGLDRRDDLDGVAALMSALDGVISAETAVLALAGTIGAPTLGFGLAAGWVGLGRPTPPWYPAALKLHRHAGEDWAVFMRRLAAELEAWLAKRKEPGDGVARLP